VFDHHFRPALGIAILVLFSIHVSLMAASLRSGPSFSHLLSSRVFSLLAAPAMQDTAYPPPQTQVTDSGYPAANTPTATSGNPGSGTATPSPTHGLTPGANTTQPAQTLTLPSGTQQHTPTTGSDIFLTENAEMGQSQATLVPTETPSPSPTQTLTATLTPFATAILRDQGFTMNWGAFTLGFFGMVIIGSAAWFVYIRRILFSKD